MLAALLPLLGTVIDKAIPDPQAAVQAADQSALLRRLLAVRLRFMTDLSNWPAHGRGWARRIADLMET